MTPSSTAPVRRVAAAAAGLLAAGVLAACTPSPPPVADGTIMGPSQLNATQIAAYVCFVGRCTTWQADVTPTQMAQAFIDEGNAAGVRGDIAFCQAVLETGWFAYPGSPNPATTPPPAPGNTTFPGYMMPWDHNYAGIGAFPGSNVYLRMPTAELGVRAQIQLLRHYADATAHASDPTNLGAPFLPTPGTPTPQAFDQAAYHGAAPRWVDLDGRWAVPGTTYGQTILQICNNIRAHSGLPPITVAGGSITSLSAPGSLAPTEQLHADTTRHQ